MVNTGDSQWHSRELLAFGGSTTLATSFTAKLVNAGAGLRPMQDAAGLSGDGQPEWVRTTSPWVRPSQVTLRPNESTSPTSSSVGAAAAIAMPGKTACEGRAASARTFALGSRSTENFSTMASREAKDCAACAAQARATAARTMHDRVRV